MSELQNFEYEAMTPAQRATWHIVEAQRVKVWRRRVKDNTIYCTTKSLLEANRHERCAEMLTHHYRLKA